MDKGISRRDALNVLRRFGITGEQIYFVDFFPLIEMIWADGQAQAGEIAVLEDYIEKHVKRINALAGCEVLRFQDAKAFADQFIEKRPDPEIMNTLRNLVKPLRLAAADDEENKQLRDSLLCTCMDIASSSVTEYPYDLHGRFSPEEKKCFFSILESLAEQEQSSAAR